MSNIVYNLLINGASGVTVGGTGVTVKYFPNVPGASIGVASTNNGYLRVPGNNAANGQRLSVRAGGNYQVATASGTVTIGLYPVTFVGTVGTVGATAILSAVAATTSEGEFATAYPFQLTADIVCDSGSGLATLCSGSVQVDGTNTNGTAGLITGLSAINMGASIPFGLVLGVTFATSETGNSATCYQFDLSQ